MMLQLDQAQLDIQLEALQERVWALREEAAGKSEPRPGSHRHQLQLEAHGIQAVMSEIEEQVESK